MKTFHNKKATNNAEVIKNSQINKGDSGGATNNLPYVRGIVSIFLPVNGSMTLKSSVHSRYEKSPFGVAIIKIKKITIAA